MRCKKLNRTKQKPYFQSKYYLCLNTIQISGCSVKSIYIIACLSSEKDNLKSISYQNKNKSTTNYCPLESLQLKLSIQLSAKSYKNVSNNTYILTRTCMIFFGCFEVKSVFLSLTYMQGKKSILFEMFFQ